MNQVLAFFGKAEALLQALIAGGIIKSSSGIVIGTLLGDVAAVVKGAQNPTPQLTTQVEQLLGDLKVNGILEGKFIDELNADLGKFATFAKAIQSTPIGQAGIGPREVLLGVPGSWVYIPDSAEAAVKAPLGL